MPLSARNGLSGTVRSVETSGLVAEVTIELDDGRAVTSVITSGSAERLELAEGDDVEAIVKATQVMVQRD